MEKWQTNILSQVGGCTDLVRYITTQISLAKKNLSIPSLRCSKGILLHGKPGIGKTALALTVASKVSLSVNMSLVLILSFFFIKDILNYLFMC